MTKASYRNGRSSKINGVFNSNHNTLECVRLNQPHIDKERIKENIYVDFTTPGHKFYIGGKGGFNSKKRELERYNAIFQKGIEERNKRYIEQRHPERVKDMKTIISDPKTAPMETIWQIGNHFSEIDKNERRNALINAFNETIKEIRLKYGKNVEFLDFALHMDEQSPHIHSRCVFKAADKYGNIVPNQTKALEEMGFERPDLTKPKSRFNNPLISFTDTIREIFYQNCERQGIQIDREVANPSRRQEEILQYKVDQMRKEIEQIREINASLVAKSELLTKQAIDSQNLIDKLEQEKEQAEQQMMSSIQNAILYKKQAELEKQKFEEQQKLSELLEEENAKLRNEIETLRNQRNFIKKDIESGVEHRKTLSAQIEACRQSLQEKQDKISIIDAQLAEKQSIYQETIEKIEKVEDYEHQIYASQHGGPGIETKTIPAVPEKKNILGKVIQKAEPEKVIMTKEDYDKMEERSHYDIRVDCTYKIIRDLDKKLSSNETIRKLQETLRQANMDLNGERIENRKLSEKIRNLENFINERGQEQEFYNYMHPIEEDLYEIQRRGQ